MPNGESVFRALASAGFNQVEIYPFFVEDELRDLFLYSGKHRPELYFDPTVRSNISSFARLCSDNELQSGLERLEKDLACGAFVSVAAKFSSSTGDYAYVVARADA